MILLTDQELLDGALGSTIRRPPVAVPALQPKTSFGRHFKNLLLSVSLSRFLAGLEKT